MNLKSESITLIDLFTSGLQWLLALDNEKKSVRYSDWKRLMKSARPNDNSLNDRKLLWLWHAITSEPSIKSRLGNKIVSLDDEWKSIKPFECLPQNSGFGIFFRGFKAYG
jgi:hypothetical protein